MSAAPTPPDAPTIIRDDKGFAVGGIRLPRLRTSSFVSRPVAKSWNARRTNGARSGSGMRLLPIGRGGVQIAEQRKERPPPEFQRRPHPRRVFSRSCTSLSNCAKAASTPSISFPVDVSSIGSVADRKRNAEGFHMRAQCEVIVFLASKSREVEDDDELHPTLVGSAGKCRSF